MLMIVGLLCMGGLAMAVILPSDSETNDGDDFAESHGDASSVEQDAPIEDPVTGQGSLLEIVAEALREAPEAEPSDNQILGGMDDDSLIGGPGDDFISGNGGNDELLGDAGADTIVGGSGQDIVVSDDGNDIVFGEGGNDALHGRLGNDFLNGGAGQDSLFGGEGDDTLFGGDDSEDFLIGAAGDDVLIAGQNDYAHGGVGKDTFILLEPEASGEPVEMADFDPDEDNVVILIGPELSNVEISIAEIDDDPGRVELRLNDKAIAVFNEDAAPFLEDVQLMRSETITTG